VNGSRTRAAGEIGMALQRIVFIVAGAEADRMADALLAAGALAVELADADAGTALEQPAFGEPGEAIAAWQRTRVSALLRADTDAQALLASACAAAGAHYPVMLETALLEDQDWVRVTRDQFKPIAISKRLWIVPTWERVRNPSAINLRLDPGVAFGTGSHPTTRLCLQWLDEHLARGAEVLDYGCGSGILAIAALHLGAARAVGIDIDPQALIAARANAMQNGVAAQFLEPGAEIDAGYHVVLANILANPLVSLAPLLAARTLAGGHVVLSGILQDQAAEVASVYATWYEMTQPLVDEGWALLVGRRRGEAPL
jgi:ribosomal protein L11 methyltransferase